MGWEHGRYYTRSRKVNGRVIREYFGGGEIGQLVADMDALDRAERKADAERWRKTKQQLDAMESEFDTLDTLVNLMARATLVAAGFHQHNRSEWRRHRERKCDRQA